MQAVGRLRHACDLPRTWIFASGPKQVKPNNEAIINQQAVKHLYLAVASVRVELSSCSRARPHCPAKLVGPRKPGSGVTSTPTSTAAAHPPPSYNTDSEEVASLLSNFPSDVLIQVTVKSRWVRLVL